MDVNEGNNSRVFSSDINLVDNKRCIEDDDDAEKECLSPYSHGTCQAANVTNVVERYIDVNSFELPVDNFSKEKKRKKERKVGNLTLLTELDWSAVIEASRCPISKSSFKECDDSPRVSVVFFIIKNCRYCKIILPQMEKLSEIIQQYAKTKVYLVNCSISSSLCEQQDVHGYPSAKLYRGTPCLHLSRCITDNVQTPHTVLDYHRSFEPMEQILEWLNKNSLPSVNKDYLLRHIESQQFVRIHDVILVGTVITRHHALLYLPAEFYDKWYSFQCFQTTCEMLFGKATCYVTMTKDFGVTEDMRHIDDKNLFLIKLELFRSDDVHAKLFELGVPVANTIHNEQDTNLHKFHNSHSYLLDKRFRCENNHSRCSEYIVKFVRDHSRSPLIHLSHDGFHIIDRISRNDAHSKDFSIVIVLAHNKNITEKSHFLQEIYKAAYELYRHVMFASLDVDEYPWWAKQFVPRNYDIKQELLDDEQVLPLHHYPRLCIVKASDHHQAAFYPNLDIMDNSKTFMKYWQVSTRKISLGLFNSTW
ncbi:uncharacterized protein LOC124438394 [Xenia sp. Carnegie-2017]|uniref:uncharacterized protein LOC124438394 n=1 Tax=Xenia sp. Carnegie-2017 TaxID=2897299 RepID=UPI001F038583|nr:uncharacterized protein LOC124438394 [Xenia sp. Carnegie-2017]